MDILVALDLDYGLTGGGISTRGGVSFKGAGSTGKAGVTGVIGFAGTAPVGRSEAPLVVGAFVASATIGRNWPIGWHQ